MRAKWFWAGVLAVCAIGMLNLAVAIGEPQSPSQGSLPIGDYTIETASLHGQDWEGLIAGTVSFDELGSAQQKGSTRQLASQYKFQPSDDAAFTRFTVETTEDVVQNGGGGPRHGILRELDSGELEVLENTSANQELPSDFSEATKANASYFRLIPNLQWSFFNSCSVGDVQMLKTKVIGVGLV